MLVVPLHVLSICDDIFLTKGSFGKYLKEKCQTQLIQKHSFMYILSSCFIAKFKDMIDPGNFPRITEEKNGLL